MKIPLMNLCKIKIQRRGQEREIQRKMKERKKKRRQGRRERVEVQVQRRKRVKIRKGKEHWFDISCWMKMKRCLKMSYRRR